VNRKRIGQESVTVRVKRRFRADFGINSFWESAGNHSQNQPESPTLTVTNE